VSELFSPVSGTVVEVQADLTKSPEKINTDPHGEAWMIVIELADAGEAAALMDAAAYEAFVASEAK
jgi:glycine cleavage system H protein